MSNRGSGFGGATAIVGIIVAGFLFYSSNGNSFQLGQHEDSQKIEQTSSNQASQSATSSSVSNQATVDNSNGPDLTINKELLNKASHWNGTNDGLVQEVNNGKSDFSQSELSQKYIRNGNSDGYNYVDGLQLKAMDDEGRTQQANAYITKETTSGEIGRPAIPATSAPSGWLVGARYQATQQMWVGGRKINTVTLSNSSNSHGYPFNQGHLIGWQMLDNPNGGPVGKVMDQHNLVVETREANAPVQLRYENEITKAAKSGTDVRLQVTPVYKDNEQIPRVIHYMAKSTNNNSVDINVAIINAQQGLKVDYQTGANSKFE